MQSNRLGRMQAGHRLRRRLRWRHAARVLRAGALAPHAGAHDTLRTLVAALLTACAGNVSCLLPRRLTSHPCTSKVLERSLRPAGLHSHQPGSIQSAYTCRCGLGRQQV